MILSRLTVAFLALMLLLIVVSLSYGWVVHV